MGFSEARNTMKAMADEGISPSVFTYFGLLRGYCAGKDTDSAMGIITEMKEEGVERIRGCYTFLINTFIKAEEPLEVIDLMKADSFRANTIMYNDIVALSERQGQTDRAQEISTLCEQERQAALDAKAER